MSPTADHTPPNDPRLSAARQQMLEKHLAQRGITSARVLSALEKVPRHRFLNQVDVVDAYADRALPINCQQTISQPYMVGLMTQSLELSGNERVLEIGTGSGYQTAILAELASKVISIERHATLSHQAAAVLAAFGSTNIELKIGDGTLGWPAAGPYDRVLVTASAPSVPAALLEQLALGGILVIPIGDSDRQTLQAIRKTAQGPMVTNLVACRFVPLIGSQGWGE